MRRTDRLSLVAPGLVPSLLQSVHRNRRSGRLLFVRGDEGRSVRFVSGHIAYGEASVPALRLGAVLVAAGRLEEAVLAQAAEVAKREGKRLGAVLTGMGLLDESGLEEALALHVRAILASVFSLRDGSCTFQDQDPGTFLDDDRPLAVSTAEAVLAAVRALRVRDDVRFALGGLDRILALSDDPLVLYQRMDLGSADAMVLSGVDGARSASEVLAVCGLPALAAERSLLGLVCTGLVEYGSQAPPVAEVASPDQVRREILELHAGIGRRPDHEILGVASGASAADLKAAYFRLARRYHPDVTHEPGLGDLRDKLESVFVRLHAAYRALSARSALGGDPSPSAGGRQFARRA
ncbi:MAG TPA: DUF4388 domain-containing protein [Vicinamibacteria bacterium]|nr:DUF4388 domain-containing protein [Vicinamibacteria bacterium]